MKGDEMDKPSIGSHVVIANSNNALANTAPHGAPSYPPDLICLFSPYNSTSSLSILVLYISAIVRLSRFLPLPSPLRGEREETSIHRYFSNLIHQLINQSYRMVSRCCSHCGSNGHNSRTCLPAVADDSSAFRGGGCISGEIMLFGVRVKVDPMRKSVSMNNLSQYEQPQDLSNNADISAAASAGTTGYASADDAAHHQSNASRERKRGVPWTEEEHKLFLLGLQKVGKGDWRGISRNFVKTRTPTQVASHAQKYFLRRSNLNRRRRRSSLFDITTDSVTAIPVEEELVHQDNLIQHVMQSPEIPNIGGFPAVPFPVSVGSVVFPLQIENPSENLTYGNADQVNNESLVLLHPIPVVPMPNPPPTRAEVSSSQKLTIGDSTLSLKLSLSSDHQNQLSSRHSVFQAMPNFSNRDDMISVA